MLIFGKPGLEKDSAATLIHLPMYPPPPPPPPITDTPTTPCRRPVLIFGEPGLEKDNLAALIHFGSRNHAAPFVRLDCDRCAAGEGSA